MTAWHRGRMLAWDTETTSPYPDTARIVTATALEVGPDGIGAVHEWLINPGVPISPGATAVHGITDQRARADGMPAGDAIQQIADVLRAWLEQGLPVVGFNVVFDATILDRETRRHDLEPIDGFSPIIDSHVLDKHCDPYRRGKRTLTATSSHYGVELTQAHHSLADALAAARLAFKLAQQYPAQLKIPLPDLHAAQRGWRFEQAASLQSYFRRTDPTAVVNGDWPIQTLPAGWTPELVDETEEVAS